MQSLTHKIRLMALLVLSVALVGLPACSDNEGENNSIGEGGGGRIMVQPISVSFSRLELGVTETKDVTIWNIHDTESLRLNEIKLEAREGGTVDDLTLKGIPKEGELIPPNESVKLQVEFTARGRANAGLISIVSSDTDYTRDEPYTLNVDTLGNRPELAVDPQTVRFPRLSPPDSADQMLELRNYGSAPLIIHRVSYSGGSDFRIEEPEGDVVLEPYDSSKADENPDTYILDVPVHYAPQGGGGDSGEILIESNDTRGDTNEEGRGIYIVDVRANAQSPCILVDGTTRHFGQVPIGGQSTDVVKVTNCGSEPLEISGIELAENTGDNEFDLDLGSWDVNGDGQLDDVVDIDPGDSEMFQIDYGPIQVGSDTGKALILSNDPAQSSLELELVGRGSDGECPEAVVTAKVRGVSAAPRPTVSAAPLDYIVLDASTSDDPDGRVVDYEWTALELPDGAQDTLGATSGDPTDEDSSRREFRALLAGTYKYGVEVIDNEGFRSCNQAVATIVATPLSLIHI